MLQKINERIKGVVAWAVIIIITLTFTLFGVDYYIQSKDGGSVEVSVNDETISKQAFELQFRRERQSHDPASINQESEKLLKKKILDEMVENVLVKQGAHQLGFAVSSQQADSAILGIPQFQAEGHFSQSRYEQALSAAMYTPESFQEQVRSGMLINQQRFALMGTAFALPDEIDRFVRLYLQKRTYDECIVPAKSFEKNIKVSDQEIAEYFKNHQSDFMIPEQVKIEFVRLSMNAVSTDIDVSLQSQQEYYEANKHSFTVPAQWKVAHILLGFPKDATDEIKEKVQTKAQNTYKTLLKQPDQFQKLVESISDDKLSARHQGELPWITAGTTAFDQALLKLKKQGDITQPVLTDRGYELFRLINFKKSHVKPFEDVSQQIKDELVHDLSQSKYSEQLEKLSELSYQTPDTLTGVVDILQLPIEKTEYFTRQGTKSGITANKKVVSVAFSPDVLELGNNSEPIQLDDNTVLVLRVLKHQKVRQKPLSDVRKEIYKKILNQKSALAAQKFGDSLIAQHDNQSFVEQNMRELNLTWKEVKESPRDSATQENPQVNEFAFTLSMNHRWGGTMLANGDYALVKLSKIHDGHFNELDKELQASISQQIEANYGILDYTLYVKSLMKKAKIG